jgi:hypothetical protein
MAGDLWKDAREVWFSSDRTCPTLTFDEKFIGIGWDRRSQCEGIRRWRRCLFHERSQIWGQFKGMSITFHTVALDFKFSTATQDGNDVRDLFDTVHPIGAKDRPSCIPSSERTMSLGETPTGRKLHQLFEKYLPLVEDKNHHHRPITIVVITDGVPSTSQCLDCLCHLDKLTV